MSGNVRGTMTGVEAEKEEGEEGQIEELLELGDENDEELRALKAKIEEEKTKPPGHKRENTDELKERLEKQIADATAKQEEIQLKEEEAALPQEALKGSVLRDLRSFLEEPQDTKATDETAKELNDPATHELETEWAKHIQDASKADIHESQEETGPEFLPDSTALMTNLLQNNLHLRKMVSSPQFPSRDVSLSKTCAPELFTVSTTFLYDLLLESNNFHTRVVRDYDIRRLLLDHEPPTRDQ